MEVNCRATAVWEQSTCQMVLNMIERKIIAHVGCETAHMHHTQWHYAALICIPPTVNTAVHKAVRGHFPTRSRVREHFPTRSRKPRTTGDNLGR